MGLDYYGILDIPRSSTDAEIKRAYRRLSIKYHPLKTGDPRAQTLFALLGEAYDVLSNLKTKAVYDQFGEEGLKQGIPVGVQGHDAIIDPYTYHGDPDKTFREFYGGDNPFQEYHEDASGRLVFGGLQTKGRKVKDPPIELDLLLSLEEMYHGCMKKMKITRRVLDDSGMNTVMKDKILSIIIKPGWPEGTRITFSEEGDQGPNKIPADIIFNLKDKPHKHFRRQGHDLVYIAPIPLGKALTGCTLVIPTIDGRILHVPVVRIINPQYKKIIPNEGMPYPGNITKRGDLIIEFKIDFPDSLSKNQKTLVRQAVLH